MFADEEPAARREPEHESDVFLSLYELLSESPTTMAPAAGASSAAPAGSTVVAIVTVSLQGSVWSLPMADFRSAVNGLSRFWPE